MQEAISKALDGETMRGMPDLGDRTFGLRVGVEGSAFSRLPKNRRVLILDAKGRLLAAILFPEGVFTEDPEEGEVVASVLEAYLNAVQRGIELHLRSATSRTETFERVSALAAKVADALR